eukprot:10196486-Karenia_brevis.AAC.1
MMMTDMCKEKTAETGEGHRGEGSGIASAGAKFHTTEIKEYPCRRCGDDRNVQREDSRDEEDTGAREVASQARGQNCACKNQ